MGQRYSLTTISAASASIDIPEFADLIHEKTLGSARFMKSIRARSQQGLVLVKAVVKPYPAFELGKFVKRLTDEREILMEIPNALGYWRIFETGTGGFVARQYMHSSVYDRMSTRPFLEDIEKKWMAFQLLCAVRDCHARNVYHGDIKTENMLVTSWNWLYLTDFSSSYKPAYLPEDNPADFSFFFDTSGRRTCYLAPERFLATGEIGTGRDINWAMDIFSVGCVIAELFLEGPIFSLSQIFKYRVGDYSPEHTHLDKIDDQEMRDMILHMIKLDPEQRYSAEEYLTFYRSKIFPSYFYGFLHQYMGNLTDPSHGRKPVALESWNHGESDDKIERVYLDFDKISYFLGYNKSNNVSADPMAGQAAKRSASSHMAAAVDGRVVTHSAPYPEDGTLLFLTLVSSSLRNTAKASARMQACDLLVAFAARLPDEAKLDRVLPYIVGLLNDRSDMVRIVALRSMTQLLSMVEVVSPINAYVFPEYIFPRLKQFILGPSANPTPIIRATYASCLGSLAQSSSRILDVIQSIRADGRLPALSGNDWTPETTYHGLFDVARMDLVLHFEEATKSLITDPDPSVRRAFLGSVATLCVFFGSSRASDVILSHLNTYLNDRDWILKCSFFEALVGVAAYVGSPPLKRFILPLMIQTLTDAESFVVEKVLRALARIAAIGLFQKSTTWELISIATRFLIHPSNWIREAAVQFIVLSTRYASAADKYCIVLPIIQPFLRRPVVDISELQILDALRKPLSRSVLEMAILWATKVEKGLFWKAAAHDAVFVLPDPETPSSPASFHRRITTMIPSDQRRDEDEQWLDKLRGLGMGHDDEMKLLALREFIWRVAHHKAEDDNEFQKQRLNSIVSLNEINVTPQTIFFDNKEPLREVRDRSHLRQGLQLTSNEKRTIADALLDASTTFKQAATQGNLQTKASSLADVPAPSQEDIKVKRRQRLYDHATTSSPMSPAGSVESSVRSSDAEGKTPKHTGQPSKYRNGEASLTTEAARLNTKLSSDSSLRHHTGAMDLINRKDMAKADAAVATISENAFGRLDGPMQSQRTNDPSPLAVAANTSARPTPKSTLNQDSQRGYEPNHSYTGNDPNILRLLSDHFVENYPIDFFDFGQIRYPLDPRAPIRRASDPPSTANGNHSSDYFPSHLEPWRPTGDLLVLFSEHTAAVNRVVAAPDHAFFVTASDDGTCKIWDTTRLEKNVTPRSRHTYRHASGSKVKCLCFVEKTHTFVSAADDGSVHAVKVEYKKIDGSESIRYGKPTLIRQYQISPAITSSNNANSDSEAALSQIQEHAAWLYHFRTASHQSILLVATSKSQVLALDLKTMTVLYILGNPLHHGTLTTFCVDRKQNWLILGTSHGILDMWDLRFHIRVRSWGTKSGARIDRLAIHPGKGRGRWILVSCGGELTVWDVEKLVCREIHRPSTYTLQSDPSTKAYEPWLPDEEPSEKILARFARDLPNVNGMVEPRLSVHDPSTSHGPSHPVNPPILALEIALDNIYNPSSTTPNDPTTAPFLITGGMDRTLRLWDVMRPEASTIFSSPDSNTDEGVFKLPKARYELSHPITANTGGQILLVHEILPQSHASSAAGKEASTGTKPSSTTSTPGSKRTTQRGSNAPASSTGGGSGADSSRGAANKPPRSTVISAQQQALLRSHLDSIMDVCVLQRPYGIIVSVDRGGGVYVFQ